ncbi:MAG TPA: sugar ABC transporter substrate-binding protein [Actinomycetota bacterium]|nr:sugar ABC transporter substrate-binding protein [Actinomycetota bacterium]
MNRVIATAISVVLATAGCSSDGGSSGEGETAPIRFQIQGEPEEISVYRALVDTFEDEVPGIDVEVVEVSEEEDALAKLATSFAAGDAPELFIINYREFAQFAQREAIEPVGRLLEGAGISVSDYYEQPVEAFTYNDELQCLPQNISSLVVYYNTQLFKAAGVKRPQAGWTVEEFRDVALTLTKGDVHGLGIDARVIRAAPFIWSNGGELVDDPENPTRFTFDEPAAAEAVRFLIDLVQKDKVIPSEEEQAGEDLETRFTTGKLGMFLGSRRDTPKFREILGLEWDVAPLPVMGKPAGILHSDAYCISKGAARQDEIMRFVAFALGEEGQTLTAFAGRTVPSLKSVASSQAFLDPGQPPAHPEVFLDGIPHIRKIPVIPAWAEIESLADEILTRLFFEPDYSIEEAVADLNDQTRDLFGASE